MKLYTFYRSSAAFRVRIALNLKGLTYESVPKHLRHAEHRKTEYLAINPQGLVPVLEHDGAVLTQSLAIIEYLDERFPTPPLLPRTPAERAQVRAMAQAIACEIHPLNNLRVLDYLREVLGQDDDGVNRWYRHWIAEGLRPLEELVRRQSGDGQYCFGNAVSLADVLLVPQMYNARRFKCDLTPFPTLVKISAHLEQLAAFAAARPEAQPDAE
jgi:maleylacetoacetate isomerase